MVPRFVWTKRADGDLSGPLTGPLPSVLDSAPRPVTWLEQVHGSDVVVVSRPGEHAGARVDAAVTAQQGCTLIVRTADCAPIVLLGHGAVGLIHAGWRGLVGGVVGATVSVLRSLRPGPVTAHLGPCIHPCCYEFGEPDRGVVGAALGPVALAETSWGSPAVDLPSAVAAALAAVDVELVGASPGCTGCSERWFSHRRRHERQRFATAVWMAPS